MKIKSTVATPALSGLIYSADKQQVGVVVDGVCFYPDGSCELGMGKTLALGTGLDFMLRVIASAERHAKAEGMLIPIDQYAAKFGLPLKELSEWAATPLGYVCGCRRIKIGFASLFYVPGTLQAEMVAAQEWMESDLELEARITEELGRRKKYMPAETIAENLATPLPAIIKQLDRMCLKKLVETRENKYRLY